MQITNLLGVKLFNEGIVNPELEFRRADSKHFFLFVFKEVVGEECFFNKFVS